jgi:hypothetical protein
MVGAFSQRDMVGCELSRIGQPPAGKFERWILAQMIEVVGVLIAVGDGENARTKDAVQRKHHLP